MSVVISIAKECIPRGFHTYSIPKWSDKNEELHDRFAATSEQEVVVDLSHSLDTTRRETWTVEMGFQKIHLKNLEPSTQTNWLQHKLQPRRTTYITKYIESYTVNTPRAQHRNTTEIEKSQHLMPL